MPEEMQTALNKLREVMTDIEDKGFTEQAESWLRSNFDLIAITSVEYQTMQGALTDFETGLSSARDELTQVKKELDEMKTRSLGPVPRSGKGLAPPGVQMGTDKQGNPIQLQGDQILDPSKTNSFLQRSGAHKSVANISKIKEIATSLKKSGGGDDGGILAAAWNAPMDDEIDPYADAHLPADPYDGEDHIDPIMEQYVQSSTYNPKDVNSLQKQQGKVATASRELAYGGSVGSIVRAGS